MDQSRIVKITFINRNGFLSAADFTDSDATVICRENGFQSGLALRHLRPKSGENFFWLRNTSCTGTESKFNDCPNARRIGELGHFDDSIAAAVSCFNTKGMYM